MKTKLKAVLTLLLVLAVHLVYAQSKSITGTVTDADGVPLPGVNIVVQGTTTGTQTDFDGNFAINVAEGQVLVFTYLGFRTESRTIGSSNTLNVRMQVDAESLSEVVVVGYGTQSKRLVTDNISSLSSADIADVPTPNVFNSVAAKAAGVQITQQNGKVEGGLNFRIRGQASISAGTDPLFVLDGIPLTNDNESNNGSPSNPLLTLSPSEIESIDILKDASAAAIYGSRGANGVVIITTKKGKEGRSSFSLNFSTGTSEPANKRDWLNAAQYIELFTEAAERSPFGDLSGSFLEGRFDRYSNGTDWRNLAVDTDWQELAFQDGSIRDADFSMSGGNSKTTYFFSTAYNDTQGIVRGNELDRVSGRININHNFSDKIRMGMNMSYSRVNIDRIANDNAFVTPLQAIAQAPISPAFLENGDPNPNTLYPNFLLEDKYAYYNTIVKRFLGRINFEYDFTDWLTFTSAFSHDLFTQTEDQFRGRLTPFQSTNGEAFASNVDTENYVFTNLLRFNKTFNEDHDVELVVGSELNKSKRRATSVEGNQFPSDDFQTVNSAAEIVSGTGSFTQFSFLSYFARATYSYKNKYLLKASIRRDGSSRFGSENRFGYFPAFSAGWIISEEDFLSESDVLSYLKIRGSWGKVGNAEIGNFPSLNLFQGVSYNQRPGLQPTQAGNPLLGWEASTQTDIGFEYGLFDDVITGEFAYYVKDTDDLLFAQPLPGSSGNPNQNGITRNIGRLQATGFEISISTKNFNTENFTWNTNFNFSKNDVEVKELPDSSDVIFSRNILREGEQINSFYLPEYAGVDPDNGDALYNLNDGSGGTTTNVNEAERIVAGRPLPEWIGGLTNTIRYKDFDFSFTFQGEWGASIYNSGGRFQSANADFFDNQTADQLRRWQNPGDITDVPEARLFGGNGTAHSTRYLEDGDFIRLRNLTLGYTLPQSIMDKLGMTNVRFYVSGLNLLTFTDFEGYDPESRSDAGGIGQVFYSAPAARTYSIGVNLNF
ncbi:SusC/RagA family TonB-linked outer membrane protein [Lentiprolixibacter aurantiacus]|uniref:TonB-dependent receptor n=1 Tax=Lentiprolixibacter aurantiacus TaxID=2993939 RepID=A0AAE3MNA8_9FLAO|nr:TonB-dependent receptor [Lentiprolixibacter aurantiacus]MCX2720353.1 TonB-dependent receptor [Lentiprolixibacter aurantiacus]